MIETSHIDFKSQFYPKVMALGRKYASSLGFMPEGGFEDHVRKQCVIVAHEGDSLCGYVMYREVPRHSRISIVHLCVDDAFRGQKVSKLLLDSLRQEYETSYSFNGISLNCRDDYEYATKIWQRYGFTPRNKIRSRSQEEHYLTFWWYSFNKPDLFSQIVADSTKIKALLDANIIMKLRDAGDVRFLPAEDPTCLLADWLVDETEFYYASEMFNEISRDKDKQRVKRTKGFLNNFQEASHNIEERKSVSISLSQIMTGITENDVSDREQVATCIVSDIKYFLTFDEGILEHRDSIEQEYNVKIMTPQEFIITLDQILHEDSYSPRQISGAVFHTISKLSPGEVKTCAELFWYNRSQEKKKDFINAFYQILNENQCVVESIKKDDEYVALYATRRDGDTVSIPLLRLVESQNEITILMGLMSQLINQAIESGAAKIIVEEESLREKHREVLYRFGFLNHEGKLQKLVLRGNVTKSQLLQYCLDNNVQIDVPDLNNDIRLFEFERFLFPLKISDLNIPCYVIPIKPKWAQELFDTKEAGSMLFGVDITRLWNVENVYYRSARTLTEVVPARILWYVSADKHYSRNKGVVATSYVEEVITGLPKDLFRKFKHYGIYKWEDIYKLCGADINKPIRAIRFGHTEVFNSIVPYNDLQKIMGKKNTFQSPVEVSEEVFNEIYILKDVKRL